MAIKTVAIGGLGALGFAVAREIDRRPDLFDLVSVAVRNVAKAQCKFQDLTRRPQIVAARDLAAADIVVEAAAAAAFREIVRPAVDRGRIVVVASGAALLANFDLVELARGTGAVLLVPSGAIGGLDAVRAAALDQIEQITLKTRKPPLSLSGAPYLQQRGVDLAAISKPACVFAGTAREAASGFPANANVAAAIALAGIGPDRTQVEIWADPGVDRNIHEIRLVATIARLTITVEAVPSADNPRTSRLAAMSVVACLHRLQGPLQVGS
jgi:aspartate dehydrogenase